MSVLPLQALWHLSFIAGREVRPHCQRGFVCSAFLHSDSDQYQTQQMFQVTINRTLWIWGKTTKSEDGRKGLKALLCSPAEMAALTPVPCPGCVQGGVTEGLRDLLLTNHLGPRGEWLIWGVSQANQEEERSLPDFCGSLRSLLNPQPAPFAQHQLHCCSFLQNSKIFPPCGSRAIPTPVCTGPTGA